MEAREKPYGKVLSRQGFDPDLPKGAPFYSLGALLEEALAEARGCSSARGGLAGGGGPGLPGEGRPGEALLMALRKARGRFRTGHDPPRPR